MSEAELFVMRARLQGGILEPCAAWCPQTGLTCWVVLRAIPTRLCLIPIYRCKWPLGKSFAVFSRLSPRLGRFVIFTSNTCSFHGESAVNPRKRELAWGPIQHHDVLRVLHQPAYAGAYVFGRTRTTKTADGKVHIADLPRSEWDTLVLNMHVGYISL
jgi:hypothetical protein